MHKILFFMDQLINNIQLTWNLACVEKNIEKKHTHTHTHIYIYIKRERERERDVLKLCTWTSLKEYKAKNKL